MPRFAAIYTYPWDLADEGVDAALDRIAGVAQQTEVQMATSYHISTYFLPHNPKRQIYFGEDGMVLFQPEAARYQRRRIRPRVSELVTGSPYYSALVDAIRNRGLRYGAWMVYAYNHHLARAYPDCAKQDALGNLSRAQLCVGNPETRAYFRTLTQEVLERFRPDSMFLESLSYLPFSYGFMNPKVFMEITPRDQYLLGLCFCQHCVMAASRSGMDSLQFREAVAKHLRASLPLNPTPDLKVPVDQAWRDTAFDSRLAHYLATRSTTATRLYEEMTDLCHRHGTKTMDFAPDNEAVTGLNPERVIEVGDRFCLGEPEDARRWKAKWPNKEFLWSAEPPDTTPELEGKCRAALAAGADGFTFYNYGLLREENLRHIGDALKRV